MVEVPVEIRKGASNTSYGQGYSVNPVEINAGDTVEWTNKDSTLHTITSGEDGIPDGRFGSQPEFPQLLSSGTKFSHKFIRAGQYHYFCSLHPNETGVVRVAKGGNRKHKVLRRVEGPVHVHFFFVDIVSLSDSDKGGTESQIEKIMVLHDAISKCKAYSLNTRGKIINLTGDGMVIGFLKGPELPLELAMELHKRLRKYNSTKNVDEKIQVRIGIHSSPILMYKDILGKKSVWGDGIVLARRVMDLGNAGDILLSDKAASDLKQFDQYRNSIDYVGEYEIKHGKLIKIYYAHGDDFGGEKPDLNKKGVQQPQEENKIQQRKLTDGPILQIVNFGVEPPSSPQAKTTNYHPNLRNDGNVPVSDVRIYYKTMDRVVNLKEIIDMENPIKSQSIVYEGSVLPSQSARVDAVVLPRTDNESSSIFWLEYDFGENGCTEIIFDVRFKDYSRTRTITYLHSDIERAKRG